MTEPLAEWIEKNNLKRLENDIAITINEVDDIGCAVDCIMILIRQELELRGVSK
jgi:hypothetical protein